MYGYNTSGTNLCKLCNLGNMLSVAVHTGLSISVFGPHTMRPDKRVNTCRGYTLALGQDHWSSSSLLGTVEGNGNSWATYGRRNRLHKYNVYCIMYINYTVYKLYKL